MEDDVQALSSSPSCLALQASGAHIWHMHDEQVDPKIHVVVNPFLQLFLVMEDWRCAYPDSPSFIVLQLGDNNPLTNGLSIDPAAEIEFTFCRSINVNPAIMVAELRQAAATAG
jgi:hypothetical protein